MDGLPFVDPVKWLQFRGISGFFGAKTRRLTVGHMSRASIVIIFATFRKRLIYSTLATESPASAFRLPVNEPKITVYRIII